MLNWERNFLPCSPLYPVSKLSPWRLPLSQVFILQLPRNVNPLSSLGMQCPGTLPLQRERYKDSIGSVYGHRVTDSYPPQCSLPATFLLPASFCNHILPFSYPFSFRIPPVPSRHNMLECIILPHSKALLCLDFIIPIWLIMLCLENGCPKMFWTAELCMCKILKICSLELPVLKLAQGKVCIWMLLEELFQLP